VLIKEGQTIYIVCPSLIYTSDYPFGIFKLLAIIFSVLLWFTFLITPLVSSNFWPLYCLSLYNGQKFEDTKGVIRSCKSKKNRQHNGQKKKVQKDKQRSSKQWIIKTKTHLSLDISNPFRVLIFQRRALNFWNIKARRGLLMP
jgi:hypothetical protein